MIYQLVKSDQAPQIRAVLKREDNDAVVDFENGSCALKFRKKGTTSVLFTLAASDVGLTLKTVLQSLLSQALSLLLTKGITKAKYQSFIAVARLKLCLRFWISILGMIFNDQGCRCI